MLAIKSDYLKPLAPFAQLKSPGGAYALAQADSADPYIATGAWCALLTAKLVPTAMVDRLLAACRYGAVRTRAFEFASAAFERALARKIAETAVEPIDTIRQRRMLAELAYDFAATAAASGELYLASGTIAHLLTAAREAENASGWQVALVWAIRAVAVAPFDPRSFALVLAIANSAGQTEVLQEIADILKAIGHYPQMATIFAATAAMKRGDAEACLAMLAPLTDQIVKSERVVAPLLGQIRILRATAQEKLGNFRAAYKLYVAVNGGERAPIDPELYYQATDARDYLVVPPLSESGRHNLVQMVGFPRSGTTLLENALAAHPAIETFEEIPALRVTFAQLERTPHVPAVTAEMFDRARQTYYRQIDMRQRHPSARVLVDKMPLRSADAPFIVKLFPEWRYIFSIRHPFDVVLSCFKQRFKPNVAMENFRTIEDTVRLYDYAMTRWFQTFGMDDPRVAYVRYEALVLDFEATLRRVLDFVGLDWDDAVNDFANAAAKRAARTPSYAKVRQGLGIGVQTAWRNYDFIFEGSVADPLRKWADKFGYETDPRKTT
jgi:hypothetical protein